ncbi:MAG: DUF3147 family protein [Candidatus Aminicenantes bacterium]|nr:DUF3147 family protein [Candidatus Aminicenantes bacterium]
MIDSTFILQVIFSFIVGSLWILMTTLFADRFGSKIGGFIGGLPSTAAVSFFFIGLTQSPQAAALATTVFPMSYAFTGLFLILYALFWRKGFIPAFGFSISAWFFLSACVVLLKIDNFIVSVCLYFLFFIFAVYILEYRLKLPSIGKADIHYSALQYLIRAVFGGFVVALAVFLSRIGGPVFGGIFSAFPAVFISILFINYRSRGMKFSRAMTKPLLVTGMISIFMYGLGVRYLYPSLGLWWGTLGAYVFSLVGALLSYHLIQKNLS